MLKITISNPATIRAIKLASANSEIHHTRRVAARNKRNAVQAIRLTMRVEGERPTTKQVDMEFTQVVRRYDFDAFIKLVTDAIQLVAFPKGVDSTVRDCIILKRRPKKGEPEHFVILVVEDIHVG